MEIVNTHDLLGVMWEVFGSYSELKPHTPLVTYWLLDADGVCVEAGSEKEAGKSFSRYIWNGANQ